MQAAAAFYKLPPDAITAFHDELDLVPGKLRVKLGGWELPGTTVCAVWTGNSAVRTIGACDWALGIRGRRTGFCPMYSGISPRTMSGMAGAISGRDRGCGAASRIRQVTGFHDAKWLCSRSYRPRHRKFVRRNKGQPGNKASVDQVVFRPPRKRPRQSSASPRRMKAVTRLARVKMSGYAPAGPD